MKKFLTRSFFLTNALVLIGTCLAAAQAEPAGLLVRQGENFSEQREKVRINRAVAHYARARSLLLAAIDEFDKGKNLADPSLLLDDEEWRAEVTRRAKALQKVLAPQPREATAGVALPADNRLLGKSIGR